MTTEEEPRTLALSEPFVAGLAAAVEMYGEPVVAWAWDAFMPRFLVFAQAIMREQELSGQATAHKLDAEQAKDGLALLGALRGADNPHNAWLAAEILLRHLPAGASANLLAALGPPANEKVT